MSNVFASATHFGTNLEITVTDEQFTTALNAIDAAANSTNALSVRIENTKDMIDQYVLEPLINSFSDADLKDGLRDAYVTGMPTERTVSIGLNLAKTRIATSVSQMVMDELRGRRGILDDVDSDVQDEMQIALHELVVKGITSF